jgi:hypothetical protein
VSLRDAISDEVDTSSNAAAYRTADAVLAMPEMEAIRQALRSLAAHRVQVVPEEAADWFAALNLPQSVIDWVLAKDTTQ